MTWPSGDPPRDDSEGREGRAGDPATTPADAAASGAGPASEAGGSGAAPAEPEQGGAPQSAQQWDERVWSRPPEGSAPQPYVTYEHQAAGQPYQPYPQPPYAQPYQPYPQPPYGQPYPGHAGARQTNGLAVAALVCSLAGLLTVISAPVGAVLGHYALRQISRSGEEGAAMAKAAIWVGWIITGVAVVSCCALLALALAASRNGQFQN
ncbi:MAG TPA: DUF4190 domain-containing protein [Micromonosporaceae bacterium]|jgi:hypothetical protein